MFKGYFLFNKRERNGILVFTFLILIGTCVYVFMDEFVSHPNADFTEFQKQITQFEAEQDSANQVRKVSYLNSYTSSENTPITYFPFDPNLISQEQWEKLGFKEWQVKTIMNYRAKGGKFRKKEDVGKIYGVSEEQYANLEPYINIPETEKKEFEKPAKSELKYFVFDPNTLEEENWKTLGFKDWQIKTVMNFRAKGGKFYKKEDVRKIYGLSEEDYYKLEPYISIPESNKKAVIEKLEPKYFRFDPNTLDENGWKELGFKDWQVKMVMNFKSKGGRYYKKEDMLKMYGMTEEIYEKLEPYIAIAPLPPKPETTNKYLEKTKFIDINTASQEELVELKGIGVGISARIIKYRENLGGFTNKEQLQEVFGISLELYESIKDKIIVSDYSVKQMNINIIDESILIKHPYVSYHVATAIINYRQKHGRFMAKNEIKKVHLVTEDLYKKLEAYITVK